MVEPIMYFGIGFLVAALLGLGIVPLVHHRAIRLTMKRLEAATPLSMAEIQADKDQLRAEFAMSARRLEMSIEQLKAKTTGQLAELGRKSDAINRLKFELGEKNAAIFALEAREKSVKDQLRTTEEEYAARTEALRAAERDLSDKTSALALLNANVSEITVASDARQVEIEAMRTQIAALKTRVESAEKDLSTTEQRLNTERVESIAATTALEEARGKVADLSTRLSDLDKQVLLHTREAELTNGRITDLENRLATQGKLLAEREYENNLLKTQIENAVKTEAELRTALTSNNHDSLLDKMRDEKNNLEKRAREAEAARETAQAALAKFKTDTEASWASERMENALLRERINDVAAEVAKLAMALEGEESPIGAILTGAQTSQTATGKPATTKAAPAHSDAPAESGSLAHRIKALQNQASRLQPSS